MKKLAIGCGVVVLLICVAGAGVAYYIYRQVKTTVAQFSELAKVPELERSVRNQSPFVPPASAELTEGQLQKLVQVQSEVRRRLGERMAAFETKYKALAEKKEATMADGPALLQAYGDLATTWIDAKRAQIEALNSAGLSLDEYRWIRDQAYTALGMPFVDLDIRKLADDARRGVPSEFGTQLRGAMGPAGPESNRTLVEKVKKLLEDNIALASFGL
jgi:hypothetical protein